MTNTLWIVLGVLAACALVYVVWVAGWARKSEQLDKQIDYSKMREWKDDERK